MARYDKQMKEKAWNKGMSLPLLSPKHKRKIRESIIELQERLMGRPLVPQLGKNEKRILDSIEEKYNFPIQRQYKVAGYFLDGYIPELKIAFEVDEEYHFDEYGNLSERDIQRQKEIETELNCQFIRIKTKTSLGGDYDCCNIRMGRVLV